VSPRGSPETHPPSTPYRPRVSERETVDRRRAIACRAYTPLVADNGTAAGNEILRRTFPLMETRARYSERGEKKRRVVLPASAANLSPLVSFGAPRFYVASSVPRPLPSPTVKFGVFFHRLVPLRFTEKLGRCACINRVNVTKVFGVFGDVKNSICPSVTLPLSFPSTVWSTPVSLKCPRERYTPRVRRRTYFDGTLARIAIQSISPHPHFRSVRGFREIHDETKINNVDTKPVDLFKYSFDVILYNTRARLTVRINVYIYTYTSQYRRYKINYEFFPDEVSRAKKSTILIRTLCLYDLDVASLRN